ncbi:MAG: pyridoxal-phosphate dependent enzyme [Bacteroidota bacterium]|nr:pyridoxal-phosphate dependent enzyme [Bacteroidota bacterium]
MFWTDTKANITDTGPFIYEGGTRVTVRRLDLMDPVSGGNKWFKLKYNLVRFHKEGFEELVTFGGAYSNHIAAVARAGKELKFSTTGIIRGEPASITNATLSRAAKDGMQLIFLNREAYRKKDNPTFVQEVLNGKKNYMVIPEGGCNTEGVLGCREIVTSADNQFNHVIVACGTGTTAAGIIASLKAHQQLIGISVLRNGQFIAAAIRNFLQEACLGKIPDNWRIEHEFHFGGYAKSTPELLAFCENFTSRTAIPVEPVYTGKVFYGLEKLIASGGFPSGSEILVIHTGGMQYLL